MLAIKQPAATAAICHSSRCGVGDCCRCLRLGSTIASAMPNKISAMAAARVVLNGICTEPNSPKLSITRLKSSCPSSGRIVVCSCPSVLNKNVLAEMVNRAIMPPSHPHQGIACACAAVGSTAMPQASDTKSSAAKETAKEINTTAGSEPVASRSRALAAVCTGTMVPVKKAAVKSISMAV